MLIFLLGYMGSGKTVIGQKLAEALHCRFLDMDEMIEISTCFSISDYFEKIGESAFRKKERDILLNHLLDKDTVIATGGGTPCFEDNMELMNRHGITVFLDTPIETIMERLKGKIDHRPLLNKVPHEQLPEFIREHLSVRRVYYERANIKSAGEEEDLEVLVNALVTLAGDPF